MICYSANSCTGTHVIPMMLRNHSNNRFLPCYSHFTKFIKDYYSKSAQLPNIHENLKVKD